VSDSGPREDEQASRPSGDSTTTGASETSGAAEPEWVRRRRLAAVFGDVLPEQTSDDRSAASGSSGTGGKGDDWYRDQVPPHHG
jgi:hypothetical protein